MRAPARAVGLILPALLALLLMAAPLPVFARGAGADIRGTLTVGERTRSWILHVPAKIDPLKPAALVIALHGGGGHAEAFDRFAGLAAVADREGFLLVFPNGTGRMPDRLLTWNSGNCCGSAMDENVDDIGFLREMVRKLADNWKIDPHRVFATGISNGAMMAYRMACEMSDVVAGIAPVAGAANSHPCKPMRPVSVIAFHGTSDLHVLYEGGRPVRTFDQKHARVDMSVADAIEFWTSQDGCAHDPQRTSKGSIGRSLYAPCRENTAVEVVTIRGGGHSWPGGAKWAPFAEQPTKEISASQAMWAFFKAHTRTGAP
jgi:polyhydroxybutyrate depolymerase